MVYVVLLFLLQVDRGHPLLSQVSTAMTVLPSVDRDGCTAIQQLPWLFCCECTGDVLWMQCIESASCSTAEDRHNWQSHPQSNAFLS